MGNGVDIATLGIRVEATQVGQATQALRGLEAQGARVEAVAGKTTVGMGRLNNALLGVARQATGTSPVLARMLDVMLGLAIGGAKMTAVLGGLTALAIAYRRLTADAREANQAMKESIDRLDELVAKGGPGPGVGDLRGSEVRLAALQAEMRVLRDHIRNNEMMGLSAEASRKRLTEVAFQSAAERERLRVSVNATATVLPEFGAGVQVGGTSGSSASRAMQGVTPFGFFGRADRASVNLSILDRVAAREREMAAAAESRANVEADLAQARVAANQALVGSLMNVGRAYGGVTDQVAALAAATLSMSRMPMDSAGDRRMAYGTAGMTGLGYGASTANPMLGGLAGGYSGYRMGGGDPYTTIIGAVTGIVGGLLEAGQRAEQAARVWRNALTDYRKMFDETTPNDSNVSRFQELSGGRTVDEAGRLVAALQKMQASAGYRDLNPAQRQAINNQIAKYQELLDIYNENAKQAADLTDAEERLHDARRNVLQALNAPAGLNLAGYGYRAESAGGITVQGDFVVNVDGAGDSKTVANAVFEEGKRRMRSGAPSPYLDNPR